MKVDILEKIHDLFIYDLMSDTEANNLPDCLFINFKKAFDSVSWSFVYKVLVHLYGYDKNLIGWIKILKFFST